MKKIVAIHQPNFFPWLGYFDKISRSDVFVLLDNVFLPKTGGTWGNRVMLMVGGIPKWVTMPIVRSYSGQRRINEMITQNISDWRTKMINTIQTNYGATPHFREVFPIVEALVKNPENNLAVYNMKAIHTLSKVIGLSGDKCILASTLCVNGKGTDLLISITKAVGGTAYMCGGGSAGYQDDSLFDAAGLELIYQKFVHPPYDQNHCKVFVPGLSIIDALFNAGIETVAGFFSGKPRRVDVKYPQ